MHTADLNKSSLRALCKTHGIKNYSLLTNDGMRAALAALDADKDDNLEDAVGDTTPAAAEAPAPVEAQPAAPAANAKAKRAPRPRGDVSVKQHIAETLAKGPLSVADLMQWVVESGRSKTTAHRQVRELGFRCHKGAVVVASEDAPTKA